MCGTEQSKEFEDGVDKKFARFKREEKFVKEEFYKSNIDKKKTIFKPREKYAYNSNIGSVLMNTTKFVVENNNLVDDGDYAPGILKVSTAKVSTEPPKNNSRRLESYIECDFSPFHDPKKFMKQASLAENAIFQLNARKFEDVSSKSTSLNKRFEISNIVHSTHARVLENNNWKEFLKRISKSFTDPEFPPDESSIIGYGKSKKNKFYDINAQVMSDLEFTWYRATDMMEKVSVVKNGIEPDDIYQGRLGDCYFLSSVSALAEHSSRVKRLLLSMQPTGNQAYAVALNISGVWQPVYLDDHFPVIGSKLAFCHTRAAEIWSMLLEKAYAKVNHGFWNIGTGGFAEDALRDLTGAPTEYVFFEEDVNIGDLWERIVFWDKKRYVMVSGSKGSNETRTACGIIQGHAYTIINAHVLKGEKVLEMRNPWGDRNEWNGRWGDNSEVWTPSLRKRHNVSMNQDDGRFFMPYEEYLEYFDHISVCYYEDDYHLSSFKEQQESEFLTCYKFEIKQKGNYYVSLSQPDARSFEYVDNEPIFYSCNGILVVSKTGQDVQYEGGCQGAKRDVWVKFKVDKPTEIYIFVKTNWLYPNMNSQFGLSVYGPQKVNFVKIVDRKSEKTKLKDLIYAAMYHKASQTPEIEWIQLTERGEFSKVVSVFEHSNTGYGYYCFKNNTKKTIEIELKMDQCVNLQFLIPKASGDKSVTLNIPPGQRSLVIWDIYSDASSVKFKTVLKLL